MKRTPLLLRCALVGCLLLVGVLPASAHNLELTEVELVLEADRGFTVDLVADLDALALGAGPDADDALLAQALESMAAEDRATYVARLVRLFERRVRVRFDGEPAPFEVAFPETGGKRVGDERPTFLGLVARLSGEIPPDAEIVTFTASRAFPPVQLTVVDGGRRVGSPIPIERGGTSPEHRLGTGEPSGRGAILLTYLKLGFWHILPAGLDHILFVLGLFFLAARWRPLLWQVSAFTLAHTLTLALATSGVVSLPSSVVEPLIALSISVVAIENLFAPQAQTLAGGGGLRLRSPARPRFCRGAVRDRPARRGAPRFASSLQRRRRAGTARGAGPGIRGARLGARAALVPHARGDSRLRGHRRRRALLVRGAPPGLARLPPQFHRIGRLRPGAKRRPQGTDPPLDGPGWPVIERSSGLVSALL